jgi:hypothetical protein
MSSKEQSPLDSPEGMSSKETPPLNSPEGVLSEEKLPLQSPEGIPSEEKPPLISSEGTPSKEQHSLNSLGEMPSKEQPTLNFPEGMSSKERLTLNSPEGMSSEERPPFNSPERMSSQDRPPLNFPEGMLSKERPPLNSPEGGSDSLHLNRNTTLLSDTSGTRTNKKPTRPTAGLRRKSSTNTQYVDMLLEVDTVPKWHNIAIGIFSWLLLAGFVVFPGTFTSIQNTLSTTDAEGYAGDAQRWIVTHIRNLPLLIVAGICCVIGALGMVAFWIRWHANYVWIRHRIFLVSYHFHRNYHLTSISQPTAVNGLTGVVSTVVNVYTAQDKQWSITARVSGLVELGCLVVCGLFFFFYSRMLAGVKKRHRKEVGKEVGEYDEEEVVEKVK